MFLKSRKKFACFLYILFLLFHGMYADNAQIDSFSACADSSFYSRQEKSIFPPAAFDDAGFVRHTAADDASIPDGRAPHPIFFHRQKTLSTGFRLQLTDHETLLPCETALTSRQTMWKSGRRFGRSGSVALPFPSLLSLLLYPFSSAEAPNFFHEVISNTVIINYIHWLDGKKS